MSPTTWDPCSWAFSLSSHQSGSFSEYSISFECGIFISPKKSLPELTEKTKGKILVFGYKVRRYHKMGTYKTVFWSFQEKLFFFFFTVSVFPTLNATRDGNYGVHLDIHCFQYFPVPLPRLLPSTVVKAKRLGEGQRRQTCPPLSINEGT